jgi:hypothetical protein
MCVPKSLLPNFATVRTTKILGAWDLGLSKEPNATHITEAAVAGFMMPKSFVETAWISDKGNQSYTVRYWVIPKPGMDSSVIVQKANGIPFANTTNHQRFKASLEQHGIELTSIKVLAAPTAVSSMVLRNRMGQNVNPFEAFPEM